MKIATAPKMPSRYSDAVRNATPEQRRRMAFVLQAKQLRQFMNDYRLDPTSDLAQMNLYGAYVRLEKVQQTCQPCDEQECALLLAVCRSIFFA